ncbi:MAG: hypothetical protein LM583_09910 [Desulfurococcaceae archaeon]|nr:hypothetical protein [Desulfurococcaceae archaeon]
MLGIRCRARLGRSMRLDYSNGCRSVRSSWRKLLEENMKQSFSSEFRRMRRGLGRMLYRGA